MVEIYTVTVHPNWSEQFSVPAEHAIQYIHVGGPLVDATMWVIANQLDPITITKPKKDGTSGTEAVVYSPSTKRYLLEKYQEIEFHTQLGPMGFLRFTFRVATTQKFRNNGTESIKLLVKIAPGEFKADFALFPGESYPDRRFPPFELIDGATVHLKRPSGLMTSDVVLKFTSDDCFSVKMKDGATFKSHRKEQGQTVTIDYGIDPGQTWIFNIESRDPVYLRFSRNPSGQYEDANQFSCWIIPF